MAIPLNEVISIHQGVLDLQNGQKTIIHQMETILAMATHFWWMIVSILLRLCIGKSCCNQNLVAALVAYYRNNYALLLILLILFLGLLSVVMDYGP